MAALAFMVGAKFANVGVPLLLKNLVDAMTIQPSDPAALLVVPVALLIGYGALRLSTSVFTELRSWCLPRPRRGSAQHLSAGVSASARPEPAVPS